MKKISLIQGPNLNLLGLREPAVYGSLGLDDLNNHLIEIAEKMGFSLTCFQSNIEGELVTFIQDLRGRADFLILNAGAYTHTSIALRDALLAVKLPFIEVHISNVDRREEFRKVSYLSDLASGVISGLGVYGYQLALEGAKLLLSTSTGMPAKASRV